MVWLLQRVRVPVRRHAVEVLDEVVAHHSPLVGASVVDGELRVEEATAREDAALK